MLESLSSDPAAVAAFLRSIFWLCMFAIIAVLLRLVPEKVRKILTFKLF